MSDKTFISNAFENGILDEVVEGAAMHFLALMAKSPPKGLRCKNVITHEKKFTAILFSNNIIRFIIIIVVEQRRNRKFVQEPKFRFSPVYRYTG